MFRALVARGLAIELTENVRQVHAWERRALDQLRDGQPEPALAAYARERSADRRAATGDAARGERLVADWAAAGDPDGAVMIAQGRKLTSPTSTLGPGNASARRERSGPRLEDGRRHVRGRRRRRGQAQRHPPLREQRRPRPRDRDRARIRSGRDRASRPADPGSIYRFLSEPTTGGDPPLVHGYAITGHIAQGLTVDRAFVLAGEGIDREWAYVALSRGRHSNRLYLAAAFDDDRAEDAPARPPTTDPIKRLARQFESSSAQVLAIDTDRASRIPTRSALAAEALEARATERPAGWNRSLGSLPGRRRELEAARAREADARRARLEAAHAARPVDAERDFGATVERGLRPGRPSERPNARSGATTGSDASCERSSDSDGVGGGCAASSSRRRRGDRGARRCAAPAAGTPPPVRLVDAATLARALGVERSWVYAHAKELHAIRLGGKHGRLRFDLAKYTARLNAERPMRRRTGSHPAATA